jgi:hypothetical protein
MSARDLEQEARTNERNKKFANDIAGAVGGPIVGGYMAMARRAGLNEDQVEQVGSFVANLEGAGGPRPPEAMPPARPGSPREIRQGPAQKGLPDSLLERPRTADRVGGNANVLKPSDEQVGILKSRMDKAYSEALDEVAAGKLSKKELGPVLSVAIDMKTGRVSKVWRNDRQGDAPNSLSQELRKRLASAPDHVRAYEKTKGMGSHGEIYAVDELMKARPDAKIGDIAVYTIDTRDKRFLGQRKPPCIQCDWLLEGVHYVD